MKSYDPVTIWSSYLMVLCGLLLRPNRDTPLLVRGQCGQRDGIWAAIHHKLDKIFVFLQRKPRVSTVSFTIATFRGEWCILIPPNEIMTIVSKVMSPIGEQGDRASMLDCGRWVCDVKVAELLSLVGILCITPRVRFEPLFWFRWLRTCK